MSDDEYGRRTLDFVERLQDLKTFAEIKNVVLRELEWFGLTHLTSWKLPGPGEGRCDVVDLNTRPADYTEHYVSKNLIDQDPLVIELFRSVSPFTWNDVRNTRRLNKAERFIMDEAKEFGVKDGIMIPIVSTIGSVGLFSPCGRAPDLSPRARAALEIIGIYGYHALRRSVAQERREQKPKSLTRREREIMKWVAAGKSDDEIGEILNIGRQTVTTHVENAKKKLNAVRRSYAIVQALRFGEITL